MPATAQPELVFLHTSPAHIDTFNELRDAMAPALKLAHVVREDLLCAVRKAGKVTAAVELKLEEALNAIAAGGAKRIVCTCSTLGPAAERAQVAGAEVMRIDRAMAREAVRIGGRIAVCVALPETLEATVDMIREEASLQGGDVQISAHVFDGAWADFADGRLRDYYDGIAMRARDLAGDVDVIVLAQASMAPAKAAMPEIGVPVISSPRRGFMAAIA